VIPHAVTVFGIGVGLLLSLLLSSDMPVDNRPLDLILNYFGFRPEEAIGSLIGALAGAAIGGGFLYLVGEAFHRFSGQTIEKTVVQHAHDFAREIDIDEARSYQPRVKLGDRILVSKEYLGFGDVMLMLMVGTFLGVPLTLLTMLVGSLVGSIVAAVSLTLGEKYRNFHWPYGTFLGAAAIFASLRGEALLDWYLNISGLR